MKTRIRSLAIIVIFLLLLGGCRQQNKQNTGQVIDTAMTDTTQTDNSKVTLAMRL
jgi:hypothetical protein